MSPKRRKGKAGKGWQKGQRGKAALRNTGKGRTPTITTEHIRRLRKGEIIPFGKHLLQVDHQRSRNGKIVFHMPPSGLIPGQIRFSNAGTFEIDLEKKTIRRLRE